MTAALAPTLTAQEARRITAAIRADLSGAVARMRTAIDAGVPAAMGYPTAWAWADTELGDLLRELRLPRPVRLALVDSMDGMPVRDISERLGVSVGTVQNDRSALGKVIPLGRRRQPAHDPHAGLTRTQEILARVAAAGERGLTSLELDAATDWPAGTATGLLSRLERRGRVRRAPVFRARRAAYVATARPGSSSTPDR